MFISTRNAHKKVSSKEAIINGLSKDGGLYIPEDIIPFENIYLLKDLNYQDLAFEIISHIFNDIDSNILKEIIQQAYNKNFDDENITPLVKVNNQFFLELFHGPTSAFKDIALQFLPRLIVKMHNDDKDIVILTATSGDTGKAALEGFKNVKGTKIKVLYPHKMVSMVQQTQMCTTTGENVEVIAIKGNFDDCQRMVKNIFENNNFENIHLTSANSINIARLVPQCVYYFKAYFDLLKNQEITIYEKIDFIVPTGNFGDIFAGYLAKLMGLPINKLIIASNENNVLTDFFKTGIYNANRMLYNTISPSIDILISSNLERLLYMVSKDDTLVSKLMYELKTTGQFRIDKTLLNKLQNDFIAIDTTEIACQNSIKEYFNKYHYLFDTHTAVAVSVAKKYSPSHKQIILATASPFKFAKDVYKALTGQFIEDDLNALDILSSYTKTAIPTNLNELKHLNIRFQNVIKKDDEEIIINKLKEY